MIRTATALGLQFGIVTYVFLGYLDDPTPLGILCVTGCVTITVLTLTKWVEGLCR